MLQQLSVNFVFAGRTLRESTVFFRVTYCYSIIYNGQRVFSIHIDEIFQLLLPPFIISTFIFTFLPFFSFYFCYFKQNNSSRTRCQLLQVQCYSCFQLPPDRSKQRLVCANTMPFHVHAQIPKVTQVTTSLTCRDRYNRQFKLS